MSELSFLIDLLLNHDLPKVTKDAVAARIKEVEAGLVQRQQPMQVQWNGASPQAQWNTAAPKQAPSTLALMAKHGEIPPVIMPEPPKPEPVAVVAQTPATAAALIHRNETIQNAIEGKREKGRTSPRKW